MCCKSVLFIIQYHHQFCFTFHFYIDSPNGIGHLENKPMLYMIFSYISFIDGGWQQTNFLFGVVTPYPEISLWILIYSCHRKVSNCCLDDICELKDGR